MPYRIEWISNGTVCKAWLMDLDAARTLQALLHSWQEKSNPTVIKIVRMGAREEVV